MSEVDTIPTLIARYAAEPALLDRDRMLTWQQTDLFSARMATTLESDGVNAGDRVAVVEPNRFELPPVLLGLFRVGAVAAMLSPRLPRTNLVDRVAGVGARFQVAFDKTTAARSIPGLSRVTVALPPTPADGDPVEVPIAATPPQPDSPITIVFTSGSAAEPKAVLHSFANHYYNALGSNQNIPLRPGDRWLLSLPLYHVGGLGILFRCMLGGAAMVLPDNDIEPAAQIVRDRVTHLSLVPTQLRRLMADNAASEAARCLKAILLGGAPIPTGMINRARALGFPVYPTYGLSEMTSQVATASPWAPAQVNVLPYRHLELAGDGEILVKGDTLCLGYVDPAGITLPLDDNGRFHTGDLGRLDDNGGLTVLGRKDNMFISGGENIQPEQIEKALVEIDGIEEALVVPVEDDEFGRRPVAFLKTRPEISLSEYESDMPEEQKLHFDFATLHARLEPKVPRFMLPVAFYPWPQSYQQSGLKAGRAFFAALAAKLYRTRQ